MEFPRLIELRGSSDERGALSFVEAAADLPFEIRRCYWLYGMPPGCVRGAHAHRRLSQVIIAVKGSFSVSLENACGSARVRLDSPDRALLIESMTWHELTDFSEDAVCLVLASEDYDESDYIRDYSNFKADDKLSGSEEG